MSAKQHPGSNPTPDDKPPLLARANPVGVLAFSTTCLSFALLAFPIVSAWIAFASIPLGIFGIRRGLKIKHFAHYYPREPLKPGLTLSILALCGGLLLFCVSAFFALIAFAGV